MAINFTTPSISPTPPSFLTDPIQIRAWLDKYFVTDGHYHILENGQVVVTAGLSTMAYRCRDLHYLEVDFLKVEGDFDCSYSGLCSLRGAPKIIGCELNIKDCPNLTTVDVPLEIGDCLKFNKLDRPHADIVRLLINKEVRLATQQRAKWITMVNDYRASGDLLTAIAQFEALFKVPFAEKQNPEQPTPEAFTL